MMIAIEQRGYVHPEALVSTDWVERHLSDPDVRIVEVDEDPSHYTSGHLPGSVSIDWIHDLLDPKRRDYVQRDEFAGVMNRLGIGADTKVVFYGDQNNWWACYAFWLFHLFGVPELHIMDGGRSRWIEEGRSLTTEVPMYASREYHAHLRNDRVDRATRDQVLEHVHRHLKLIDVRSREEFLGNTTCPPEFPDERALRPGHIPGARHIPWHRAVDDQGLFRSCEELQRLYSEGGDIREGEDVIVYCRIGERSSHTWFVLRYLLGFRHVRNYDGGWTEWGNLVGVPIDTGS